MPRFFFDVTDEDEEWTDPEGMELGTPQDARKEAIMALQGFVREIAPNGDHREISLVVKDERHTPILTATLSLTARWLDRDRATPESVPRRP